MTIQSHNAMLAINRSWKQNALHSCTWDMSPWICLVFISTLDEMMILLVWYSKWCRIQQIAYNSGPVVCFCGSQGGIHSHYVLHVWPDKMARLQSNIMHEEGTAPYRKISMFCSVSNKHKFQWAFWARGLNSLKALTNVYGPKGNNLNLKAYKINAWIFLIGSASIWILNF